MHIDHTTLRTSRLELTRDFLIAVFDMSVGERPARIAEGIPGYWLYFKDKPLIHLIQSDARQIINSGAPFSEAIDHTAFFMEDYTAFKQKLIALKIPFNLMDLPDIGERRIFLRTPTNILLEAVFRT